MNEKSLVSVVHLKKKRRRDGQCCFPVATKPKILGILLNQLVKPIIRYRKFGIAAITS